ncbi:class I SAM-dependent methyltransferase [Pseudogracilibacillus sp. SO30301A]|uniref:class I SAM-dependent methyltransferase n=1 Tax=Pseudogracilibacillus sp. SO30301A TaxID=3098291 RepID=UPI00300E18E9
MAQEKWNKQFSENQFTYGKTANAFIQEKSSLFAPHSQIACFAEGEGRNAVYLAKQGHTVTSYDLSSVGLEHTKVLAKENDVTIETVEADLTKIKLERQKYDNAMMIFGHVTDKTQEYFIKNMINAIKPCGLFIFEVYSKEQIKYNTGGPGKEQFLYDPKRILTWIEPYTCLHFYYGEANREEGYRHTGIGHVIQVVIKKE